jgi:cytochrome c oxidase assembly protein subunit 11
MAVVFYVDPKLAEDSEQNNLDLITLSYTFYPVRPPSNPPPQAREGSVGAAAESATPAKSGRI